MIDQTGIKRPVDLGRAVVRHRVTHAASGTRYGDLGLRLRRNPITPPLHIDVT